MKVTDYGSSASKKKATELMRAKRKQQVMEGTAKTAAQKAKEAKAAKASAKDKAVNDYWTNYMNAQAKKLTPAQQASKKKAMKEKVMSQARVAKF